MKKSELQKLTGDYLEARCRSNPEDYCEEVTSCVHCYKRMTREFVLQFPNVVINEREFYFDDCNGELCDLTGGCSHHISGVLIARAVEITVNNKVSYDQVEKDYRDNETLELHVNGTTLQLLKNEVLEMLVQFDNIPVLRPIHLENFMEEYIGEAIHQLAPEGILGDEFVGRIDIDETEKIMRAILEDFIIYIKDIEEGEPK